MFCVRCIKLYRIQSTDQAHFRYRAVSISHIGVDASDSFDRCWKIMEEIIKNGPVVASMNVYVDFLIYKAGSGSSCFPNPPKTPLSHVSCEIHFGTLTSVLGVYSKSQHLLRYLGKHSVKIIGWGSERGELYWLIQNSWGELHGEAGLARIRRGTNECGIESEVLAPIPNGVDLIDFEHSLKLKIYLEQLNASAANSSSSPESQQSSRTHG